MKANLKYEILTPHGYLPFNGINKSKSSNNIKMCFSSGDELNCTHDHPIYNGTSFVSAELINVGDIIPSKDGFVTVTSISRDYGEIDVFDIVEVLSDDHAYYTNNVVSHNCAFIGSVSTLIDSTVLQKIKKVKPLSLPNLPEIVKIWELPVRQDKLLANNWEYVASLDTGMGLHKDYTVLQLFLVKSNIEAIQVATIASNKMEIAEFCALSNQVLKAFHQPTLIIEQNGIGQTSLNWFDNNGYDNLMHFSNNGLIMGLVSTNPLKVQACVTFKTYIEKGLMILRDEVTIKELMSFGKKGKDKWEGLGGANDDHVLACIWVAYYINSPLFNGNIVEDDITTLDDKYDILKSLEYDGEDISIVKDARDNFDYYQEQALLSDDINKDDDTDDSYGPSVVSRY